MVQVFADIFAIKYLGSVSSVRDDIRLSFPSILKIYIKQCDWYSYSEFLKNQIMMMTWNALRIAGPL